jgi:hypothetical protein
MILLQWLDASPLAQAVLSSSLLALVALLALSVLVPRESGPWKIVHSRWLFVAVAVLAIFASRWPSILYHLDLNPDESQMAAQAITLRHFPVPWKSYDGITAGPLDSAVLVLPALLGLHVSFVTGRLIAIALFGGTLALLFAITRTLYGELPARLSVLLPLAFFCFVRSPDFTSYSSELLPMFLLMAAAYGLVQFSLHVPRALVFAGLLLGCLPFANLQTAILGVALFFIALVLIMRRAGFLTEERLSSPISLVASVCCVPLFILTVVILSKVYRDFYISYVEFVPAYLHSNCCKTAGFAFFTEDAFFRTFAAASILIAAAAAVAIVLFGPTGPRPTVRWFPPVAALVLLTVSIYAIEVPQTPSQHYLYLLFWPLAATSAFMTGYLLAEFKTDRRLRAISIAVGVCVVLVASVPLIRLNVTHENYYLGRLQQNLENAPDPVAAMLIDHVKPGDRMAIWGWMPRYFVETGAYLGTRDAVTEFQIEDRVFPTYYRARYLEDMRNNRPKFFLDAVAPDSYKFKDWARQGHQSFHDLSELIDSKYKLIDEANGALLYERTDAAKPG